MEIFKQADIESCKCPLCKYDEYKILHFFPPFCVVKCKRCRLIFLNPRVKEEKLKEIYMNKDYYFSENSSGYGNYTLQETTLRLTFRRFLKELKKRRLTQGKLLEIGCGYGFFLDEAKRFFNHIIGLELSEEAATQAKRLTGAEIFTGELDEFSNKLRGFDVVIMINVIEHIYDPVEFVLKVKNFLTSSGKLIVATPDAGSFWFKFLGKKWPSYKIPEHVVFYNHNTLAFLFKLCGFKKTARIPFLHAFPLGLVFEKFNISIPEILYNLPVWIPGTMLAMVGEV